MARLTKESLKQRMESKGGGDGLPIVRIKKDQPLLVRFLTEPTEWSVYDEYFDPEAKKSYVVHPGQFAPAEVRVTSRYLANVLLVEDDKVMALMMPQTLAQRIYSRWSVSKKNTITDRDFELFRMGEGLKTTYMESPEAPHERHLDKYDLLDLEDIIARMEAAPGSPKTASTAAQDNDDIYDDEAPARNRRPAARPGRDSMEEFEPFPDDDEEEVLPPASNDSESFPDEDEDDEYWTKAELQELDLDELVDIAAGAGIKSPERYTHEQLVDMIGV